MSKSKIVILAIIVVIVIMIAITLLHTPPAFAANGYISDSMCGRKHVMQGASDAECTIACINAGAQYVLVAESKIYTLEGDMNSLKSFAGKQVHIVGKSDGSSITVTSISALK
jgi:hypothetical protein